MSSAPPTCLLCGSRAITLTMSAAGNPQATDHNYHYYRCAHCGLLSLWPLPAWPARQAFYNAGYRGYHDVHGETSDLQRRSMVYGLHKRLRIVEHHCPGGRLLDVGCGNGDFAAVAQRSGRWHAHGLEQTAATAQAAHACYTFPLTVADSAATPYAPGSFDVVCLWTVLEHVAAPLRALQECARLLRPGGVLVVRTVDADSWGARWFGRFWLGYDAPRIVAVFSRRALRWALQRAGLRVTSMGCHFHDFYPWLWSMDNFCRGHVRSLRLCDLAAAALASPMTRATTMPFFLLQTAAGKNSHFLAAAVRADDQVCTGQGG